MPWSVWVDRRMSLGQLTDPPSPHVTRGQSQARCLNQNLPVSTTLPTSACFDELQQPSCMVQYCPWHIGNNKANVQQPNSQSSNILEAPGLKALTFQTSQHALVIQPRRVVYARMPKASPACRFCNKPKKCTCSLLTVTVLHADVACLPGATQCAGQGQWACSTLSYC